MATPSAVASQRSVIILDSPEQYEGYMHQTATSAAKYDLWDNLNPEATTSSPRRSLVEPIRPKPSDILSPTIAEQRRVDKLNAASTSSISGGAPTNIVNPDPPETTYSQLSDDEREQYRLELDNYNRLIKKFDTQKAGMGDMARIITETISIQYQHLLYGKQPPEMLDALRDEFKPNDITSRRLALSTYMSCTKAIKKNSEIDGWLTKLEKAFDDGQRLQVPEISSDSAVINFLTSIAQIEPNWCDARMAEVAQAGTENREMVKFKDLLRAFRYYRRLKDAVPRGSIQHGAFPASFQGNDTSGNPTKNSSKERSTSYSKDLKCLCGGSHRWARCYYINKDMTTSPNFRPNPETQKKVDNALKDAQMKEKVDRAMTRFKGTQQKDNASASTPSTNTVTREIAGEIRAQFMVKFLPAALTTDHDNSSFEYELLNSFIFDTGATGHLCNNRARFTEFRTSERAEYVIAGTEVVEIEGWGTVPIRVQCEGFSNGREMVLTNVAYVRNFHTSVVSFKILKDKGMQWNTDTEEVGFYGKIYCKTPQHCGQWLMEYNALPKQVAVATAAKIVPHLTDSEDYEDAAPDHGISAPLNHQLGRQIVPDAAISRSKSPNQDTSLVTFAARNSRVGPKPLEIDAATAHRIFGHLSYEACLKLMDTCQGIVLKGGFSDPTCEICRLGDARRQISRIPVQHEKLPFFTLVWDNIAQSRSYGDETKVSHLYCPYLGYHFVYILVRGNLPEILSSIRYTINYIERQFNIKVHQLRIDGESSLINGDDFAAYKEDTGLKVLQSAPHAHEQHGSSENSNKVLTNRATKLHLESRFPDSLWPEEYKTAGYLLNRSPLRRHNWKSPLHKLNEFLGLPDPRPKCFNLVPHASKAYIFIHERPKTPKLAAKAHIGWSCGYLASNIWRVFKPKDDFSPARVMSVRDVTFDTTSKYRPEAPPIEIADKEIDALLVPQIEIDDLVDQDMQMDRRRYRDVASNSGTPIDNTTTREKIAQDLNEQLRTPDQTPEPSAGYLNSNVVEESSADHHDGGRGDGDEEHHSAPDSAPNSISQPDPQPRARSRIPASQRWTTELRGDAPRNIDSSVDESNVLSDGRRTRRQAHFVAQGYDNLSFFKHVFISAIDSNIERIGRRRMLQRTNLPPPPNSWEEMLKHPHRDGFQAAAHKEYDTLNNRGTWKKVKIDDVETTILPLRWVFSYKFDQDGFLLKYKARICVRGDYYRNLEKETYAATLAARIFRTLMAIAAEFNLDIFQLDAINAFTNAILDELVYTKLPDGFSEPGFCFELIRALYGLSRSPLLWFNDLSATMRSLGFKPVPECACLFTSDKLVVFFYVDDICVLCHPRNRDAYYEFRATLSRKYEMRDMGEMKWFLGIRVVRDRTQRKLWLCQDAYITKICDRFDINSTAKTPMITEPLIKHSEQASQYEIKRFQERVGSCNFAAVSCRPDIAYATQKLAEHNLNPSPSHLKAIDRVLAYLNGTKTFALEFGSGRQQLTPTTGACATDYDFKGFSDASLADDQYTRRSTQGVKIDLFKGCTHWQVCKQSSVSTSSTEAELLALSTLCMWLIWFKRFFDSIDLDLDQDLVAYCDNLQTVRLMIKNSPKLVTKLKHVDIHNHWVREQVERGIIKMEWISTADQAADGLTKALSDQKHKIFLKQLNVVDIREVLDRISES